MFRYFISILILVFLFACSKEKTSGEQIMAMAENLVSIIDAFEGTRIKVIETIRQVGRDLDNFLSNTRDLNPADKANYWEKDWKKVADEIKKLEEGFEKVQEGSEQYFAKLETLSGQIKNSDVRSSEQKKNDELRERWEQVYEKASQDMDNIREVLNEGNDFHKVLLSSAMRSKIDDNIAQMKGISRKAQKVLVKLANFTVDSKKILKGELLANRTAEKEEVKSQPKADDVVVIAEKGIKINSSGFLTGGGISYKPENVADNKLKTWWSPQSAENSWIIINFGTNKEISGMEIHAGSHYPDYPQYGDIYRLNYRIHTLVLEFSDYSSKEITLDDLDEIQKINFAPITTRFVRLRPQTFYPSEKWKDVCISHLRYF